MADVYTYIIPQGTIVVDTSAIQIQVNSEFTTAFGADLITSPNTPQGILITGEILDRAAAADNNAVLANQINPNLSGGVYLDAIGVLTGSFRTPATNTIVSCTLTGVPGTIVPIDSLAADTNGNQFQSQSAVTLSAGGSATVNFVAVNSGAITVASGTLNTIVSNVLGWETITNSAVQSVIGSSTQSDPGFRTYRRNTLAAQGTTLAISVTSALYAVSGVTSLKFLENVASTTQTIDGVSMVNHSIYVCINGGSDLDVATAMLNKTGGCAFNNGASMTPITQPVTVPISGQVINVLFDRPDVIPIYVIVNINANSALSNPTLSVKQAILDYANGILANGETGLGVGDDVSAFELAGAINYEVPTVFVVSLFIGTAPTPSTSVTIPINLWEIASIPDSNITVNIV